MQAETTREIVENITSKDSGAGVRPRVSRSRSTETVNSSDGSRRRGDKRSRLRSQLKSRSRSRATGKKSGERREHARIDDMKAKLERSRQSARECRARKKLRYQYLEELVAHREESVLVLRQELETYKQWCKEIDEGRIPEEMLKKMAESEDIVIKKELEDEDEDAAIETE